MYNPASVYGKQLNNLLDKLGDPTPNAGDNLAAWLRILGVHGMTYNDANLLLSKGYRLTGIESSTEYRHTPKEILGLLGPLIDDEELRFNPVDIIPVFSKIEDIDEEGSLVDTVSRYVNPFAMIATRSNEPTAYMLGVTPLRTAHLNIPNARIDSLNSSADRLKSIKIKGAKSYPSSHGTPQFITITSAHPVPGIRDKMNRIACQALGSGTNYGSLNLHDMNAIFSGRPQVADQLLKTVAADLEALIQERNSRENAKTLGQGVIPIGDHANGGVW